MQYVGSDHRLCTSLTELKDTTTRVVMPTEESDQDKIKHLSIQNSVHEQSLDSFWQVAAKSAGQPDSVYGIDRHELLVHRTVLEGSIQALRKSILYPSHHPPVAGQPGQRPMYGSLLREFHWPDIANDA